jgi:DNA-binding transcriptional LysR family regulator
MPDLALDLRFFDCAFVVAERGSFRAAAESMGLPQSTVSRRVQLLESRLGFALFERAPSGAKLTSTGQRFLRSASFGADKMRQAIMETRTAHRGELGELRLGVTTSFANGPFGAMLADYHRSFPHVDLRLDEVPWQVAGLRVLNRCLDVAFLAGEPQLAAASARKMWRERFVVALPRNHPCAQSARVNWVDIARETFLCPGGDQGSQMECLLISKLTNGCERPRIAVHSIGRDDLLGLVERGFGVFVTLDSTASDRHRDIAFVALGDDEYVEFSAVWLSEVRNPAVIPFISFMEAHPLRHAWSAKSAAATFD